MPHPLVHRSFEEFPPSEVSLQMEQIRFHHDFETFSRVDLKVVGTSQYARHDSTEPLMLSYTFADEETRIWVPAESVGRRDDYYSRARYHQALQDDIPDEVVPALQDPRYVKIAWNKPFEWNIFMHAMGIFIPHNQWRDSMVLAYSLSLPGALAKAGEVIGLPPELMKDSRGDTLMRKFSSLRTATKNKPWDRCDHITDPDDWQAYKEYCITDTNSERAIFKRLVKWNMPREQWKLWWLDQEINERGIPINMNVVRNALKVYDEVIEVRMAEMKKITGLANPNSTAQLLPWFKHQGYAYNDLKKGHITKAIEEAKRRQNEDPASADEENALIRTLELRQEVSKASVKKYAALKRTTGSDSLLRYTLQFCGAGRTWRWAGRIYQPQNLAKPTPALEDPEVQYRAVKHLETYPAWLIEWLYDYPMDVLSTCVRPVVQAPPGHLLIDADLNAIENRAIGWLGNDKKILDVFKQGKDPYIDFASQWFGESYDDLWHEYKVLKNKKKRTLCKPPTLGCGFRLGAGAMFENADTAEIEATGLLGYAWNMGIMLTLEQAVSAVDVWRNANPGIVKFWYELEEAAKLCVRTGRPQQCRQLSFEMSGFLLRMRLPSGRYISYVRPRIERKRMFWGKDKDVLTYEGVNDKKQWTRIATHGGKILENGAQGIARDILGHGMMLAHEEGLDLRLHVHDQAVAISKINRADQELKILIECLSTTPSWAKGFPLAAEGLITPCFIKD